MHLALIGLGAISKTLLSLLEETPVTRATVLVRAGREVSAARTLRESRAAGDIRLVTDVADLVAARPDLVVEAAGQAAAAAFAPAALEAGLTVVIASVGVLADPGVEMRLRDAAARGNGRLVLPAGAIGGIDMLAAIAPAGGLQVAYTGRKPPAAWRGSAAENALDLDGLTSAETFFTGTARDAARDYPKNANAAATLALAGAGMDKTSVRLVADPDAPGNTHSYSVTSPVARFSVTIEAVASPGNARTSLATVYSLLREVRRHRATVVV